MILYKDDWNKYPEAIADYNTNNKTWVRLAGLYKKMGIENYNFHLALHNHLLVGINPHDPNLTKEQIAMIADECNINPWYFLREVIRIPAPGSPMPVQLRANRANIAMYWLFFNHITTLTIMPRQTGKSVSTDALMIWLLTSGSVKTDINLLTKDDSLRVKNVKRIKEIMDLLPYYIDLRGKTDTNNTEKITVNRLSNTYTTSVAQASVKAALNLGRGMTIAVNHVDEIAFINNIDITLPAMLPAASGARESAKNAGAPYGNIFTTTPGYLSSKSGKYAKKIYDESFVWTEKFYDTKDEEDLINNIRKNNASGKLQVLLEYNHRQLGFTDQWLRERIEEAMSSGEDAGADFLNLWAEGNETSPIDKDILRRIKASIMPEPYIQVSKYGYVIRWYVPERMVDTKLTGMKLILGLDTSDAVGKDDIAMVLSNADTGETIATGTYNETNLITFSEWIASILEEYENFTLIIERKSSGVAIIDNLIKILVAKKIDPFKRIFNWVVNDANVNKKFFEEVVRLSMEYRDPIVYERYRKYFGFATSGSGRTSRDKLYGIVFNARVKYTADTVRDKKLIEQIAGLTLKNDRIDHKSGSHDDMVIAWLLVYWFLAHAENKQYYGLEAYEVLSAVNNQIIDEQGGRDMIRKRNEQMRIKAQIDELILRLKSTRDKIKSDIFTRKIRHLYKQIDTTVLQPFNLEDILKNIELEKKKSVNSRYYNDRLAA